MSKRLRHYGKWALTQGNLCKGLFPALMDTLHYCNSDPTYTETLICSTIESKILQKPSLINNKVADNISPVLLYDVGAGPECGHLYIYPPH